MTSSGPPDIVTVGAVFAALTETGLSVITAVGSAVADPAGSAIATTEQATSTPHTDRGPPIFMLISLGSPPRIAAVVTVLQRPEPNLSAHADAASSPRFTSGLPHGPYLAHGSVRDRPESENPLLSALDPSSAGPDTSRPRDDRRLLAKWQWDRDDEVTTTEPARI